MYELAFVSGQEAVADDGSRHPLRDVLPVPRGSATVAVPRALKAGRPIRDDGAKAALGPFAAALRGMLGEGAITLQKAGTRLRAIPGFSDAMVAQRIAGIGALKRFLDLFPEFVVEGRAPKATVRLALRLGALALRPPALRASLSGGCLGGAFFLDQAFALLANETDGHECLIDLLLSLRCRLVLAALGDSTFCSGDEGLDRCVDVGLNVVCRGRQVCHEMDQPWRAGRSDSGGPT